ncbi:MAG: hypothetical protein IPF53_12660 [Blastocatellia bacterium]|nr:hypothetical protein [Blastocatellia bacterium]
MRTPIDERYFCDGSTVVLVSQSLGGSGIAPEALSETLLDGPAEAVTDLLRRGVCLPIDFGTDCAMDSGTLFVVGELDDAHERGWVASLTGWLAIPCGKLVLVCGGGAGDELARAVSGEPADPDYCIYQTIDVPPGDYRVDVLAYPEGVTVGLMHEDLRRGRDSGEVRGSSGGGRGVRRTADAVRRRGAAASVRRGFALAGCVRGAGVIPRSLSRERWRASVGRHAVGTSLLVLRRRLRFRGRPTDARYRSRLKKRGG